MADSVCLGVSQILVNKASGDSVLQVLGNKARKNCQIVPALPMYMGQIGTIPQEIGNALKRLGVKFPGPF